MSENSQVKMMNIDDFLSADADALVKRMWESSPGLYQMLKYADSVETARNRIYEYLFMKERSVLDTDSELHIFAKDMVRKTCGTLKSIFGSINEKRTKTASLEVLWKLAVGTHTPGDLYLSNDFLIEFIHFFDALEGKSNIYETSQDTDEIIPDFIRMQGREAAIERTRYLDRMNRRIARYMEKFPSGLHPGVEERRAANRARIIDYFHGSEDDWFDYRWQLKNVIKTPKPLIDLIEMDESSKKAVELACEYRIPFGITPYYLSLMEKKMDTGLDHAVRAQVIPPLDYVEQMVARRSSREYAFDFMGEHDTSPIDLVTRRYPGIAILKPFNTCAQICVYCQRNWEIDQVMSPHAQADREKIMAAVEWFRDHPGVGEVLVTGGDPCVMSDSMMKLVLEELSRIDHIYRIRIGSRAPVVLPMRYTAEYLDMLASFHEPPHREIAVVTHFEHSWEISRDALNAVQAIRKKGLSCYNQQVFTVENSRRYETCKLRRDLKSIGIDPYYNFNMKGKGETSTYMVPIARILQETKEEARLLPGLDRTDEPVFNVPRLGKNHLRAWQHHRLIAIKRDGSRVYEFHPWEKNLQVIPPYFYEDSSISGYLLTLKNRGENVNDYKTIYYYY